MTESTGTGNNLEKQTLTLEENEILSDFTKKCGIILDTHKNTDWSAGGNDFLRKTKQLINQTPSLFEQRLLEVVGHLLDAHGNDQNILGKAINLSQKETKKE